MIVFILNRSPTWTLMGRTPYGVWHGVKPSVHYLRTLGNVVHVKQGKKHLSKMKNHSTIMVFIGYEPGSKAWRFFDPVTMHIHVSRDSIFEEDSAWQWSKEEVRDSEAFEMEYVMVRARTQLQATWRGQTHPDLPLQRRSERSSMCHRLLLH
jgi:hypothetical protein